MVHLRGSGPGKETNMRENGEYDQGDWQSRGRVHPARGDGAQFLDVAGEPMPEGREDSRDEEQGPGSEGAFNPCLQEENQRLPR